ncbi:hypothetical protein CYLTODRAFT_490290 [Cylindrobasidium torrendii FP15055 ss-10]|uniref:Uncharacterized protein n=1 Tax=Cylindrobasidium torrendii FP15055 ss-10 TaxID=1314674 RepID=A0A0D7BCB8_9AGAR|nr:hypothetical protein CYLTODRAFT_490290 [Cylindrobasidium torrendii FP15055 ss-10]
MGQRHQAFAIAKVVPHGGGRAYYRCVAAWHHQWCYGRLPLHAANQFCQLLRQQDNASIVLHEIAAINGKYGRYGKKPEIVETPCMYLAWLLGQAWNIDLDIEAQGRPYFSGTSFDNALLPASTSSGDEDNNDGITIVDVTDPTHPSYCFVAPGYIEAVEEVDNWVPLSAEEYVRAYYPAGKLDPKVEEDVVQTIARLDGTPVLSINALAEAWPHEYEAEEESVDSDEDKDPVAATIPSLSSLAIDAAISSEQMAGLEDLAWMPDKAALIMARLRSALEIPDSAIPVLAEAVKSEVQAGNVRVDLSMYSLTQKQTLDCISKIDDTIYSIKVPKMFAIDALRELLTARPDLRRIDLLATSISSVDLAELLHTEPKLFFQVESLIHAPLTLHPGSLEECDGHYFPAFTFVHLTQNHMSGGFPAKSLLLLYPPQIVQNLTDYLGLFTKDDLGRDYSVGGKDLLSRVVIGAATRPEGVSWHQRHVNSHPNPSALGFNGHGWMFVFSIPSHFHPGRGTGFLGFLKLAWKTREGDSAPTDPGKDHAHQVLGLREWLAVMKDEGRPMPAESAVQKLQNIFDAILQLSSMHAMNLDDIEPMLLSAQREANLDK